MIAEDRASVVTQAAAVLAPSVASPEARFSTGTIVDVNGASYLRS